MGSGLCQDFDLSCHWASQLGYRGVQVPSWDARCIDLKLAAESQTYCDELNVKAAKNVVQITELATHLQGQLVAVHPAYDTLFDGFAPESVRGKPAARTAWAVEQMKLAAKASRNLGLTAVPSFTGSLLWPFVYPWPQRPAGLVAEGFKELGRRWRPILDAFEEVGVDIAWELHPGEDVHDGISYERFNEAVGNHPRSRINYDPSHFILQGLDYLGFIDEYGDSIVAFHVKDAEFRPSAKCGVYGGFADWKERAGRFRSLGDGQVDFKAVFSKLTQAGYRGWAVLEWECCLKDSDQGAYEGAPFINSCRISTPEKAFDDFAGVQTDAAKLRALLGLLADPDLPVLQTS
ncbi:MAG: sugar phosphate isomerase/epimerase family protein [bacterium]|nr:sugar phosphate isomerase/epimerase family protein [bacterium]